MTYSWKKVFLYKIFQQVNFKDISADVILEHSFKHDQWPCYKIVCPLVFLVRFFLTASLNKTLQCLYKQVVNFALSLFFLTFTAFLFFLDMLIKRYFVLTEYSHWLTNWTENSPVLDTYKLIFEIISKTRHIGHLSLK